MENGGNGNKIDNKREKDQIYVAMLRQRKKVPQTDLTINKYVVQEVKPFGYQAIVLINNNGTSQEIKRKFGQVLEQPRIFESRIMRTL